ncbi:MAG: FadR/GntR family transcriptional regulator [Chloroflexota bacterium]
MAYLTSKHLAPIPKTSVTDEVVRRLVEFILDENLKPGDRLPSERTLTEMMRVGRTTLREGMKALSALGMVEVAVGQGTFVSNGQPGMMDGCISWGIFMGERSSEELMEARRTIELDLASLAACRATPDEVEAIGAELAVMEACIEDNEEFTKHDLEFHVLVARAAHNRVLYRMLDTIRHLLRLVIMDSILTGGDKRQTVRFHATIYRAIRARDASAARESMSVHLDEVAERVLGRTATDAGSPG